MRFPFIPLAVLALATLPFAASAETPPETIARLKRDYPASFADATMNGSIMKVGHRNPRGKMDGYAQAMCLSVPPTIKRVQVYDIRRVMQGDWTELGAAECRHGS